MSSSLIFVFFLNAQISLSKPYVRHNVKVEYVSTLYNNSWPPACMTFVVRPQPTKYMMQLGKMRFKSRILKVHLLIMSETCVENLKGQFCDLIGLL